MLGAKIVWGVEVGSHAVKGVKLVARSDGIELVDFDVLPHIGEPEPIEGPFCDRRAYRSLALFQERNRIRGEHVIVAVPGRSVFTRPIEIIEVSGKPTEELVRFEVQQHVGIDLDAVLWDYELFDATGTGDSRRRQGMLFAMKKAEYNAFIRALDAARLSVEDVQTTPVALCNFARHEYAPEAPMLLIDVGAGSTDVIALYGRRYWARTLSTGANLITAKLKRDFGADHEQAEAIKTNAPQSKHAREVLHRMLPPMRAIAGEVQNALSLFRGDVPNISFEKTIVFGGGARTLGLCRLLSQQIGGTVAPAGMFQRIPVSSEVDGKRLAENAPALSLAAGLALQGAGLGQSKVSLVSAGTVRGRHLARTRPYAIASLIVAAVWVGLSIYVAQSALKLTEAGNYQFRTELEAIDKQRRVFNVESKRTPAEGRLRSFHSLGQHRDACVRIMNYLSRTLATANAKRRMWVRTLEIKERPRPKPEEPYVLDVALVAVAQRRPRSDKQENAWYDIKQTIGNAMAGWSEAKMEGDINWTPVRQIDGDVRAREADAWQCIVFRVHFVFQPKPPSKEPPL